MKYKDLKIVIFEFSSDFLFVFIYLLRILLFCWATYGNAPEAQYHMRDRRFDYWISNGSKEIVNFRNQPEMCI